MIAVSYVEKMLQDIAVSAFFIISPSEP